MTMETDKRYMLFMFIRNEVACFGRLSEAAFSDYRRYAYEYGFTAHALADSIKEGMTIWEKNDEAKRAKYIAERSK